MLFQINRPSIPAIRAKFLIEKLRVLPQNAASISLCATGRTGSGKTTLGNRLVGIDYFMPSTGKQDCTDEVNLVEFPIGIKYFDLPGVCSSDKLENYNRAALGIRQIEDFPSVEEVTLAKYSESEEGKKAQKQRFTVPNFREGQLAPDLIFYMIAPHQQFLSADCSYLRDLLRHYHQVIYVLNMFADKETGNFSAATEQNIIDAAKRIKKVHTSVLGYNSQPIIVPVNCWTGEGISKLLTSSYEVLGSEKGRLFEELIQYQQQKTPDEYLRQVKLELFRLFAYVACQKAEGTYTCDQPIHKACQSLWDFLVDSQISEQISSNIIGQVNNLVNQIIAGTSKDYSNQALESFEEKIYSLQVGIDAIQEDIQYLNEKINSSLLEWRNTAINYRDQAIQIFEQEIKDRGEVIQSIQQELESSVEKHNSILGRINTIEQMIENHIDRHNSLVEELRDIEPKLENRINIYNSEVDEYHHFAVDVSNQIYRYNGRRSRLNARIDAFNSNIININSGRYSVSNSTISSMERERKDIEQEKRYLDSESYYLDREIENRDRRGREIESERNYVEKMIAHKNEKVRRIKLEQKAIEEKRTSAISKVKELENVKKELQAKFRLRSEKNKYFQDYRQFNVEVMQYFQDEFNSIEERKNSRIEEINLQVAKVSYLIAKYQGEERDSLENYIEYFQEQIDICLGILWSFREEIKSLMTEIKRCITLILINHFLIEVIIKSTNHYFDNVGECEYKGSTYQHFSKQGVTVLLTIAHVITSSNLEKDQSIAEMTNRYQSWMETISRKIVQLPEFPFKATESMIISLLEANIDLIFYPSFNESIKKIAL